MKYIFFGSSEFAKIVLEKLLQNKLKPVLVITKPSKPKGRKQILSPSLIQILAEQEKIPCLMPTNLDDKDFIQTIKNIQPDFILLTAYGKIISSTLLKLPSKGFLNLHPSLLPRYRGATPIQSTILAGDKETGVTLFKMDEQIDHGPIIANSKLLITNYQITYSELSKKLANLGAKLIIEILPQLLQDKITPLPQDESLATFCHKITPEDEKINWQTSAEEVDKKVRALNPNPGVYAIAQEKVIKIIKGFPAIDSVLASDKETGEVFEYEKKMAIKCGKNFYVIEELKPAGKKIMPSPDFLNGNKWIIDKIIK
ncbi:MAG: methionyl-tRNA formyltransferase [Candidatus Paceibacterota bacterium]|jgi:methionyl-tRNA formyltransferase